MVKKQILYNQAKDNIIKIDSQIFKIFEKLIDKNQELSIYDIKILENKLNNLKSLYDSYKNILNSSDVIKTNINPILTLVALISAIVFIYNIKLGLAIIVFRSFIEKYIDNHLVFDEHPLSDSKMIQLINEINNCYIFLKKRKTSLTLEISIPNEIKAIKNDPIQNRYKVGNLIIDTYLTNMGTPLAKLLDYPQEIQNMVIEILQDDLKTDKTNIVTLITMARQSIMREQQALGFQDLNRKKSRFKK